MIDVLKPQITDVQLSSLLDEVVAEAAYEYIVADQELPSAIEAISAMSKRQADLKADRIEDLILVSDARARLEQGYIDFADTAWVQFARRGLIKAARYNDNVYGGVERHRPFSDAVGPAAHAWLRRGMLDRRSVGDNLDTYSQRDYAFGVLLGSVVLVGRE